MLTEGLFSHINIRFTTHNPSVSPSKPPPLTQGRLFYPQNEKVFFHHNNKIILSYIFAFVNTLLCIIHYFYFLHKNILLSFNKLPIAKPKKPCYNKDVKTKEDSPMNK